MLIPEILFWIGLAILLYCYIGYGLLLFLINQVRRIFRRRNELMEDNLPSVSLIVSAFNEAGIIEEKIRNCMEIDYPAENLDIIFITDGSTDGTDEIIRRHSQFTVLHNPQREGKTAAITRAMKSVKTPIVVFSDANSMLNSECIRKIVRHYDDRRIGGVAGEKKIISEPGSPVGRAEGLYWQYESFMKRQDAEFHTVVGAAGELFSIRTELFNPPGNHVILDDFVISMSICIKGFRIGYEPEAFATERPSASLAEEEKRKTRIAAGAYQSIGILKSALNFFRYPLLSFQYFSRRLLRWVVCPAMLPLILITNAWLWFAMEGNHFYMVMLLLQCLFYLAAVIGYLFMRSGRTAGIISVPFYFLFMNYCLVKGFIRFMRKKQEVTWEKSKRSE